MSVEVFNNENFEDEVIKSEGTVVVDFYANWCMPCKMMSLIIDEIAEEGINSLKVGKVNVDNNQELAEKFGIMSIPTILIFKNGKLSKTFVGVTSKDEIKKVII